MLFKGFVHGLAAADDLAKPRTLFGFGVRDLVVELLLQLEGRGHVFLGGFDVRGERLDGLVAELRLGEADLLLAGADGIVGGNEQAAGLGAEFRDAQGRQRVDRLAVGPNGYLWHSTGQLLAAGQGPRGGTAGNGNAAHDPPTCTRTAGGHGLAVGDVLDALDGAEGSARPVVLVRAGVTSLV